jgi:hypothetical protein
MTKIRWKDIPGYEGLYEVSDAGDVRRNPTAKHSKAGISDRPRRGAPNRKGYMCITISQDNRERKKLVHCLVLLAFVGPRPKGMEAAHIDGVKSNNRLGNLEWTTPKINCSHKKVHGTQHFGERVTRSKLTEAKVKSLPGLRRMGWTWPQIAKHLGVAKTTITGIATGRNWAHLKRVKAQLAKMRVGKGRRFIAKKTPVRLRSFDAAARLLPCLAKASAD